jgi:hypothetical protein
VERQPSWAKVCQIPIQRPRGSVDHLVLLMHAFGLCRATFVAAVRWRDWASIRRHTLLIPRDSTSSRTTRSC